jgi:hypothetical protein
MLLRIKGLQYKRDRLLHLSQDYYTSIEPNSSDASSCSLGERHANHSKKSMADKGLVTGYYRLSI